MSASVKEFPKTCVIGAGVSGLCVGKALSDWGLPYTCFEASDEVGGNWYFRNPNQRSSAYLSLHIDTSKTSSSCVTSQGKDEKRAGPKGPALPKSRG